MSLIPEEELRREKFLNLAPMVDFLFLIVAVLATLAVTRSTLYDTEVNLVKVSSPTENTPLSTHTEPYLINLSITSQGKYKWMTDTDEYLMPDLASIQQELLSQVTRGLLPKDKQKIKVLLHIDKSAPWESISNIIFAVQESGFAIHPVYQSLEN